MFHALVIEDHLETREWLAGLMCDAFPNTLVDTVPTIVQARELVASKHFNISLVDISLPDGNGIDFVREMAANSPETYCVMATIYDDERHLFDALKAGARGYLLKEQPREKLLSQLQGILRGEPPLSPSVARRMMEFFKHSHEAPKESQLSEREIDVLTLAAKGLRRNEIAKYMAISSHTVAGHLKKIYRKLNISSQAEAALEAARLGLVTNYK